MALATVDDVETSLMRPLSTQEMRYADSLIDRAENILVGQVPKVLEHASEDSQYKKLVVQVEADMVARVFRNPGGMKNEADGTYSYSIDWSVASGRLKPLYDELDLLGVSTGLGSAAGAMDGYAKRRHACQNPAYRFENCWPGGGEIISEPWL